MVRNFFFEVQSICAVAGFGLLSSGGILPKDLMQVQLTQFHPLDNCIQNYTDEYEYERRMGELKEDDIIRFPNENNFCAGGIFGDSCKVLSLNYNSNRFQWISFQKLGRLRRPFDLQKSIRR